MKMFRLIRLIRSKIIMPEYLYKNKIIIERTNLFKFDLDFILMSYKSNKWTDLLFSDVRSNLNRSNFTKLGLLTIIIYLIYYFHDVLTLVTKNYLIWSSVDNVTFLVLNSIFLINFIFFKVVMIITNYLYYNKTSNLIKKTTKKVQITKKINNARRQRVLKNKKLLKYVRLSYKLKQVLSENSNWDRTYLGNNANLTYDLTAAISKKLIYKNRNQRFINTYYINSNYTKTQSSVSNFKNLESLKWLTKYNVVHTKSLTELSNLNKKNVGLGYNLNKINTVNTSNFFLNFYIHSPKIRNSTINLLNVRNSFYIPKDCVNLLKKLVNLEKWLDNFSKYNNQFSWLITKFKNTLKSSKSKNKYNSIMRTFNSKTVYYAYKKGDEMKVVIVVKGKIKKILTFQLGPKPFYHSIFNDVDFSGSIIYNPFWQKRNLTVIRAKK